MDNIAESLLQLREEKLLEDIDLELLRFFKKREPNIAREVQLAICMTSYLFRQGNVCLLLEEFAESDLFPEAETVSPKGPSQKGWIQALRDSSQVGYPGEFKPFILDEAGRFYMHKLWHYERTLGDNLLSRSSKTYEIDTAWLQEGLHRLFPQNEEAVDWQKVAAVSALRHQLAVISGGPGTGKTSTVVRILTLLLEYTQVQHTSCRVALAAPTGKAAARLQESIVTAKVGLDTSESVRSSIPEEALTLHQLLGARRDSSSFKHDVDNPIPYDVVVVDEASMVDQSLMSKLTAALLPDARLILLGDKDQLASVEAGSVFGDVCAEKKNKISLEMTEWLNKISIVIPKSAVVTESAPLTDNIVLLTKSYRFGEDSGIGRLSKCINMGEVQRALELLEDQHPEDVAIISTDNSNSLEAVIRPRIVSYFRRLLNSSNAGEALQVMNGFQILAAHRRGPGGISSLNRFVESLLLEERLISQYDQWYPGRPVMITVNDYTLDLYNGDTGICFLDEHQQLKVFFKDQGEVRAFAPARLPSHETAHALTVHKSQGSEYEEVLLVLPRKLSKVVSRELLYTAVTRARTTLTIAGDSNLFEEGLKQKIHRQSGLSDFLWSK